MAYQEDIIAVGKTIWGAYQGDITRELLTVTLSERAGGVGGGLVGGKIGLDVGARFGAAAGEFIEGMLTDGSKSNDKLSKDKDGLGKTIGSAIGGMVGAGWGAFKGREYGAWAAGELSQWAYSMLTGKPATILDTAYAYLEVNATASNTEINAAYRKLSLTHHPDKKDQGGSQERWSTLSVHMEVIKVARLNGHSEEDNEQGPSEATATEEEEPKTEL
jgi:hypothetical protein